MAFDFYFAGGLSEDVSEVKRNNNANILRSYLTERKEIMRWIEYKKNGWTGKLMVDNGAFTLHRKGGELNIDEYIDFINTYGEYIDYFIALDHIPGKWGVPRTAEDTLMAPVKTWENYLYMYDKVKYPKKLLPVFHQGENFKYLQTMLTSGLPEYICISGSKDLTGKQRENWYDLCYNYIDELNPNIKVHCLGSATMSNVQKYPFTSMDSTTWIMVGANGNILTPRGIAYVGDGGKSLNESEKEYVSSYVRKHGFTLEDVGTNYKARMLNNFYFILEQSRTVETNKVKVKRRSLF